MCRGSVPLRVHSQARFGAAQRGIFSGGAATPGPGQYESTVDLADPLVKRSYNITIG